MPLPTARVPCRRGLRDRQGLVLIAALRATTTPTFSGLYARYVSMLVVKMRQVAMSTVL